MPTRCIWCRRRTERWRWDHNSERELGQDDSTDDRLEALIAKARQIAPLLADAPVVARWAGVRPRWRTRAPMLGAWPGRPGQFIANGGYKIGFALAPLMAERLADLIIIGRATSRPTSCPVEAHQSVGFRATNVAPCLTAAAKQAHDTGAWFPPDGCKAFTGMKRNAVKADRPRARPHSAAAPATVSGERFVICHWATGKADKPR